MGRESCCYVVIGIVFLAGDWQGTYSELSPDPSRARVCVRQAHASVQVLGPWAYVPARATSTRSWFPGLRTPAPRGAHAPHAPFTCERLASCCCPVPRCRLSAVAEGVGPGSWFYVLRATSEPRSSGLSILTFPSEGLVSHDPLVLVTDVGIHDHIT